MANYAKIVNGVVQQVIVAEATFFDSYVDSSPGDWVVTTNGNIGYNYDSTKKVFTAPKAYASWTLDEDKNEWQPPTAYPDDDKRYEWNEDTTAWVEIT